MSFRPRLFSRRKPWPWHSYFGQVPVLFKNQQGVALYSKKEIPFENVAPQVWDYATSSPFRERDFPFRGFWLGAGEVSQSGMQPTQRYSEALNVDASLGLGVKGPHFHFSTPADTGPVVDFVEALDAGVPTLFALCGRYVNKLASDDTWAMSTDLGVGVSASQGVRFKDSSGAVDGLYVANTGAAVQRYDGSAWQATTRPAIALTVRREELWYGSGNSITKVTDDPTVDANFSAPLTVGDESAGITWLAEVSGNLVIFKEDAVWSQDVDLTTGNVILTPIATFPRSTFNGVNAAGWLGTELFAPIGGSLYRADVQIAYSAPIQLDLNPVPLAPHQNLQGIAFGVPVATAGHNDWTLYVGLYNSATGDSYLGKYGAWVAPELTGATDYAFVKAFHVAVKDFPGRKITSMKIWGRETENQRLWIGFEDGDTAFAWLPNASADTVAESVDNGGKCEFTQDFGYIRWPLHNAGFEAVNKLYRGFSAFAPSISDSDKVQQQYRVENTGPYISLPDEFTRNGQRVDIDQTTYGKAIDCRTVIDNQSINSSPVLEGMALHEQVRPDETWEYEGVADCSAAPAGMNGAVRLRNAEKLRALINEQMQEIGSVPCIMPDSTSQNLIFYDHGENLHYPLGSTGREWDLPFKAVQFSSTIELGTYRRLRTWTYRQLQQIRYRGLPTI